MTTVLLLGLAACSGGGDSESEERPPDQGVVTATVGSDDGSARTGGTDGGSQTGGTDGGSSAGPPEVLELPEVETETVTTDLAVPREVIAVEDGTLLVSGQEGLVLVLADGSAREEPFLDLVGQVEEPNGDRQERGLLGLALDPAFADNGRVYTLATYAPPEGERGHTTALTRWTADPGELTVDRESAEVLLEIPRASNDHSGGEIVFDAEGMLVTALGVDAPAAELAQDPSTLDGTVLRLDVSGEEGYAVPQDNASGAGAEGDWAPEVLSTGYRNPWRVSWDPDLGVLVGIAMSRDGEQQVHVPEAGDNAGYPELPYSCWEDGEVVAGCTEGPDGVDLTPPAMSYPNRVGRILSGVAPVRDSGIPELDGTVLVSDWDGTLLAATPQEEPWSYREVKLAGPVLPTGGYLWDIDTDEQGAVYLMVTSRDLDEGEVRRLVTE